ncbi:unnamed protein product, partial [Pylaiella littoralis]
LTNRWLTPAALFVLSFGLHRETLWGGFVWDDRPAVMGNRDVWTDSPWGDMWRHDFWGQEMTHLESHKSFRPLTTLTYRLSNILAHRLSAKEHDNANAATSQQSKKNGVISTSQEEPRMQKLDVAGRAGPEHADAAGFHLVNVVVHAATCSASVWLFRAVFAGEELPTVVASLLFTVHPVHVEAVAPIVGRADVLCGFLSLIALYLTISSSSGCASGRRRHKKEVKMTSKTSLSGYFGENESRSDSFSNNGSDSSSDSSSDSNRNTNNEGSTSAMTTKGRSSDPSMSSDIHDVETIKSESNAKRSVQSTAKQCKTSKLTNPPAAIVVSHVAVEYATASSTIGTATIPTIGAEAPSRVGASRFGAALTTAGTGVRTAVDDVSRGSGTPHNTDDEADDDEHANSDAVGKALTTLVSCHECSVVIAKTSIKDTPLTTAAPTAGNPAKARTAAAPEPIEEAREGAAPIAANNAVLGQRTTSSAVALGTKLDIISDAEVGQETEDMEGGKEEEVKEAEHGRQETPAYRRRAAGAASALASSPRPGPTVAGMMHPGGHYPSKRVEAADVLKEENHTRPRFSILFAALVFATGATLCKEVGATVFGVMAGGEVVRVFEERRCRQRRRSSASTAGLCRVLPRAPVAAVARVVSAVTCAALLVFLHVRLHEGVGVREWGLLENDISVLERWVPSPSHR